MGSITRKIKRAKPNNEEMRQWYKLSGEEQYKKIDAEVERLSSIAGEKLVWNWERKEVNDGV